MYALRLPHLTHAATTINVWVLFFAGLATVITSIVAIYAILQSVIGSDFVAKRVLLRNRKRTICRTLQSYKIPRADLRQENQKISNEAVRSGVEPSVQREIDWLTNISSKFDPDWHRPLELNGVVSSDASAKQLLELSEAYEEFGKSLRAQVLLSSSALIREQQKLASRMARYLKLNASFRSTHYRDPDEFKFQLKANNMNVELINPRISFAPSRQIDHVAVVYNRIRTVVNGFYDPEVLARDDVKPWGIDPPVVKVLSEDSAKVPSKLLTSERDFDGVLPALHRYHLQLDPFSGHLRLLLEISEISYSAIVVAHYSENIGGFGESFRDSPQNDKPSDRLITLSMMPLSSDGYLLAAQRSAHVGVNRMKFAPGVNGNLELRNRVGLKVDRDEFSLPDMILATVREAMEELALPVKSSQVQILGLGRLSSVEEINTYVLLTLAPTDRTFDEILAASKQADLTEGAWELTGKFYKIPFPKSSQDAVALIDWVKQSDAIAPHLVLALLAICLPFLSQDLREDLSDKEILDSWHERISKLAVHPADRLPPGVEEVNR